MNTETTANTNTISFLENLRSKTAVSHQNLENLPLSGSVMSKTVSVEEYAHYLNTMHDVVKSTEMQIFPVLDGIISDLDERKKAVKIENDLDFMNMTKVKSQHLFDGNFSVAFALGILYVVEGSSLGGRFILKNIESVLGFDENNGANYFAGYGNKTGSSWKNFIHSMTEFEQENKCGDEIIAGADYAFNTIYSHFSSNSK